MSTVCGQSVPAPDTVNAAQKTITRYCFGCHNDQLRSGAVSLQNARLTNIPADPKTFEKVLHKIRAGEMPPVAAPKPEPAALTLLASLVETDLDRLAAAKPNPGAPAVHRLNRAEYSNAIRDLLALNLDHSSGLPADDAGYGFDNIGDILSVSPLLFEKYMATARRVARVAIGTVKAKPAIEKYTAARSAARGPNEELPPGERGGLVIHRYFPLDAEYSVLVRVRGLPDSTLPVPRLDVRVDGVRVKTFDTSINAAEEAQNTRNFEIRVPLTAGMHSIAAGFLTESARSQIGVVQRARFGPLPQPQPPSVEYMLIGGPFNAAGSGDTESKRRIFICRPSEGQAETGCARQILTNLAHRAYRRPVNEADIAPLVKLFAAGRKEGGSFDTGIENALRAILVSPSFLFRVERDPQGSTPGGVHRISDLELASRLSFFIWSSIPDEELLQLAGKNRLRAALAGQVKRMLADPKATAMIDNFAGQWLQLRNVAVWHPDPEKYPQFDEALRDAMQTESELFFRSVIREDRSALDFINADYTYVNARLAAHYGLPNVRGNYFRRVTLSNPERGGILSQAAILTVTSYPTRTSPVLRGKWILENVIGSPPPPPPPDVPDLADSANASPRNLRAALEKHREKAACASCHSRLDPLGFALENYDAVGKFRTAEGGGDIDASGAMPNGDIVRGPGDLKKVLLERKEEFIDCLSEKLLTYALGRGLEYYDAPAVRQIRRESAKDNYRFSTIVLSVVNSVPFQMRRTPEP